MNINVLLLFSNLACILTRRMAQRKELIVQDMCNIRMVHYDALLPIGATPDCAEYRSAWGNGKSTCQIVYYGVPFNHPIRMQ